MSHIGGASSDEEDVRDAVDGFRGVSSGHGWDDVDLADGEKGEEEKGQERLEQDAQTAAKWPQLMAAVASTISETLPMNWNFKRFKLFLTHLSLHRRLGARLRHGLDFSRSAGPHRVRGQPREAGGLRLWRRVHRERGLLDRGHLYTGSVGFRSGHGSALGQGGEEVDDAVDGGALRVGLAPPNIDWATQSGRSCVVLHGPSALRYGVQHRVYYY